MKVIIENESVKKLYWIDDLIKETEDKNNNINSIFRNVKTFLNTSTVFICGKGGHHVWISDKKTKERLILITE